jgi:hypothetical protein
MTYKITDVYDTEEFVHIRGSLYAVNQTVYNEILRAKENRLAAGYAWTEFDPTDENFEIDPTQKEGQASTGDVIGRVTSFATRMPQLVTDVIIDEVFTKKGFDQEVLEWRSDPDNEKDVEWRKDKGTRTNENIAYLTLDALCEAPARRRDSIRKMTDNEQAGRIDLDLRVPSIEMLTVFISNYFNNKVNTNDIYELCARFGKTIWALSAFAISGKNNMIFTAYYQAAFGSIKNEVALFNQFSNMRVVDARDSDAEEQYLKHRANGYKVVIICGLHTQDKQKWFDKYRWVNQIQDKFSVGDEIDFGLTTERTSELVKFLSSEFELMSGTAADRARVHFNIRKHETYTYEEMLAVKQLSEENPQYVIDQFNKLVSMIDKDNHFLKDLTYKLELDIPEIGVWQRTIPAEHDMSWQKIAQSPVKHSGIIVRDTMVLLGADDEYAHLSLDNAIDAQNNWFKAMSKPQQVITPENFAIVEFLPHNTPINGKNGNNLEKIAAYRQQGVTKSGRNIKVINVDGTVKHIRTNVKKGYKAGDRVEIQNAEHFVKDHLRFAKEEGYEGVWICASQYAQRSFTVGQCYIVMLSYDSGAEGGTAQRTSRLASPYPDKDAGLVISNSFDPTRDDKVDAMLMNRTTSRMRRTGEDFDTAGRIVKRGFSIFSLNDNGDPMQWEWDEYLYRITVNKNGFNAGVARELTTAILQSGLEDNFRDGVKKKGSAGEKLDKTFLDDEDKKSNNKKNNNLTKKEMQTLLNVARNIVDKVHIAYFIGKRNDTDSLLDSLRNTMYHTDLTEEFLSQFGVDPSYVIDIIENHNSLQELTSRALYANINASKKQEDELLEGFMFYEEAIA